MGFIDLRLQVSGRLRQSDLIVDANRFFENSIGLHRFHPNTHGD
jgi:hypothetical protein